MHSEESYEEELQDYGEQTTDEEKKQQATERNDAEEAIHEVEEHEAADLFQDLSTEHPHATDVGDQSGKFRSLMEQIDTAQTEQERVKHYHDALHIFTNNWLGKQGLKIGEVAIMM
jgi:thiamine pyrophosphokinase